MTENTETESTLGKMDASTMDPGSTGNSTARESTDKQLDKRGKDIGRRASA